MLTAKQLDQTFADNNGYNTRDLNNFRQLQREVTSEMPQKLGISRLMIHVAKKIRENKIEIKQMDYNDTLKMFLTVQGIVMEIVNPPANQKGTRKAEIVMANQMILFLVRYLASPPLSTLGKMMKPESKVPYHHSSVIHLTQGAFDKIDVKDELFMGYFGDVLTKLRIEYGIIINFDDTSKWPEWYKKLKMNNQKHPN